MPLLLTVGEEKKTGTKGSHVWSVDNANSSEIPSSRRQEGEKGLPENLGKVPRADVRRDDKRSRNCPLRVGTPGG